MKDDFNYYGNPDEYNEFLFEQQMLDKDIEEETNEYLAEMIKSCGWLREKKLLKVKLNIENKLYNK